MCASLNPWPYSHPIAGHNMRPHRGRVETTGEGAFHSALGMFDKFPSLSRNRPRTGEWRKQKSFSSSFSASLSLSFSFSLSHAQSPSTESKKETKKEIFSYINEDPFLEGFFSISRSLIFKNRARSNFFGRNNHFEIFSYFRKESEVTDLFFVKVSLPNSLSGC